MRMYGSKQPFGTLPTHNAAMQGGSTPKSSQYFPILPTKAANYPIARLPRRSATKPGVCGEPTTAGNCFNGLGCSFARGIFRGHPAVWLLPLRLYRA